MPVIQDPKLQRKNTMFFTRPFSEVTEIDKGKMKDSDLETDLANKLAHNPPPSPDL